MTIGIDLSPLQNAHRMRGIGFTLINFINNLSDADRQAHRFVFYVLPTEEALFKDPLELLQLEDLNYEVRRLRIPRYLPYILPGRLNMIFGVLNRLKRFREFYFNVSRVSDVRDVEIFLQADQSAPLPRRRRLTKVLIIYDLIPYVLEPDYWWSYKTARLRGRSRLKALHFQMKRTLQTRKLRANTRQADHLLAISEQTKQDFVKYLQVPARKISLTLLGVSPTQVVASEAPILHHYIDSSWGYIKRPFKLNRDIPYLLYIGGADQRRKLEDLVGAFNRLRAQGHGLQLVLVGDIMLGSSAIKDNPVIRDALASSSYLSDITFMGFISDAERDWLYAHALAFVFPSRYEGFGLPVLEAMAHGCPVICYRNNAVSEVAGNAPIYANTMAELQTAIQQLLSSTKSEREHLQQHGLTQVKSFTWSKTARAMLAAMLGR